MVISKADLQAAIEANETIFDMHWSEVAEGGYRLHHVYAIAVGTVAWTVEPGREDIIPETMEVV